MEILDHPVLLVLVILLSILSSIFCWRGMRDRNMPELLLGVGTCLPTFSVQDYRFWIAGVLFCLYAWWVSSSLKSL